MNSGSVSPRKQVSGNPRRLGVGELHLVEAIKTQKPSISYKLVKNNLGQHANILSGTSILLNFVRVFAYPTAINAIP